MAAADPQAFFLTPPPRHLAELRIDTAPSAIAFSAPCGGAKGAGRKKRRCLVPSSSVRKRMLLELAPFDFAPAPAPSSTPPPRPSPSSTPPPSPMAPRAGTSPAGEFSFGTAPRVVVPPASPGNIFAFMGNAAAGGSEARSGLSFLSPMGHATAASGVPSFLERPRTPTATGPTANGGFVFAAPPETPTSTNTSGGLSFLASPTPKQPLTPMGSTATGGFSATSVPSLIPLNLKPARNGIGDFFAFPSPGLQIGSAAPSAAAKESAPLAGLATPPTLRNSGDKMPSLFLRRAVTRELRESLREQEEQQQLTPPLQKVAKTNASDARSSATIGSSATPCCTLFTSPSKEAAKQEAKKVFSEEASRSPAGSRCSSTARSATPEKENKQEREVEVSSSPRERAPDSPRERFSTSPAVFCSGAEVVVRVTCKCGVHKEFCFDHRL
ncbi:hypothetical protein QOZ80_2BG0177600 [Eleusine coracana subsp. coracana]|nr:hypothetical protein QOZ80_2BG0177600 [Eleusine coracana subsp. coracana]